ncbi:MAG TPA: undecaprenyl-diphosphate phosphatase [Actinomycetota bacterium]|nr:undecaprenyl-diphosphate phosphatase [Actinomycetota bacterium]
MLGITQGITEFAPVSSSGHLILVPWFFGWSILKDPILNKTFDVALHVGTLIGALLYFRNDVVRYLAAWIRSIRGRRMATVDERLAWVLVIGTIPGAVAGAAFSNLIETRLGQPWLIASMLVVFGVVLVAVDRMVAARSSRSVAMAGDGATVMVDGVARGRTIEDVGIRDGVIVGVAQAVALQPGVSRSGVTITAARAVGLEREPAARFSFLLSLPIIAGAGVFKGAELVREGMPPGMAGPFLWGMISAAVSGFLVIWFLLSYLRRHDFMIFLWYRVAVAAIVFAVILAGVRPASGL